MFYAERETINEINFSKNKYFYNKIIILMFGQLFTNKTDCDL